MYEYTRSYYFLTNILYANGRYNPKISFSTYDIVANSSKKT